MEYTNSVKSTHWTHLSTNLLDRLQNGKHTDCTFIVGESKAEFRLNRFILSLVSPVFEAMLYGNMRESEKNSTIMINDIDMNAFKCVINFAYGNDPEINLQNVTSLLMICDKYQIAELRNMANTFFQTSLNRNTFCILFNESTKIKSTFCIDLCIKFIKQSYLKFDTEAHQQILSSSHILNIHAFKVLLESDYLLLPEHVIWESYIIWMSKQNERKMSRVPDVQSLDDIDNNHNNESQQKQYTVNNVINNTETMNMIKTLYKSIRFGLMDSKYFIKSVLPKQVLSDSEIVEIMKYNICQDEGCGEFKTNARGKDVWSASMGDNMEINSDHCVIHNGEKRLSQSAFLMMQFNAGVHKWSFRVNTLKGNIGDGSDWTSSIGIYKVNSSKILPVNNHFLWDIRNTGYAFCAHSATLKVYDNEHDYCVAHDYGVECKEGDIIEMIVDMNKLELKYIINDVDFGKAFDIQKTTYRAAVNLDIPNDSIELL